MRNSSTESADSTRGSGSEVFPVSRLPEPPQARGRRSRDRVVAAAWDLITEHGYRSGEVSVRAIAATAGVSIGSIYHHFTDLDQIITAVTEKYAEEMAASISAIRRRGWADWRDMLDSSLLGYVDYFRRNPNLRDLWFDDHASPGVLDTHRYYREHVAEDLHRNFAQLVGQELSLLTHQIAIAISGSLYELAFRVDPEGDEEVITELRRVLRNYYSERLSAPVG